MTRSTGVKKVPDATERHAETAVEGETAWDAEAIGYTSDDDDASSELTGLVDGLPLAERIDGLATVVGELKEQLKDLVKVNEVLEMDLEHTRRRAIEGNNERYHLIRRIQEMEEEGDSMDDLVAEVRQLSRERDALADKVRDLSQALSTSEQRVKETGGLLDRFRAERDDASAEASCLNLQFSRAMKVIDEIRNERAAGREREADLEERILVLEAQLAEAVEQRDSCKSELTASCTALKEVRQSVLASSKESKKAICDE